MFIAIMTIYIFCVVWIPETPRWLLLRLKDRERAKAVLKYLRGPNNKLRIAKELEGIQSSVPAKKLNICQVLSSIISHKDTTIPFLVALFVCVFHQLCGVGIVTTYTGQIFKEAGASNPDILSLYTAGFGFLVARILAGILVEAVGRKILLSISAAGMCTGQAIVGIQFYLTRPSLCVNSSVTALDAVTESSEPCNVHLLPLAIAGILLFSISFGIGVGPVTWIILSEYLPLKIRGVAGGICVSASRITAVFLTGTFLSYSEWAGPWVSWWTVSFFNLVGFVVILLFVVETKGKNLEEVQELFKKRTICQIVHCKRNSCKLHTDDVI